MTAPDLRVTALGHSGLLVEAGGERVLVDPLLRKGAFARGLLAVDPPRWLRLDRLPRPSVLVLTHAHSDHFDPPSLAKVERTIPVIVPPDSALVSALQELGFEDVRALSPGGAMRLGGVLLGATPSIHRGGDEIGLLVSTARVSFWNVADTEVDASVAHALLDSRPAIDVVAARFQPIRRVLDNLTRGAGASFDKADVLRWLEAASSVKPRAVFPYGAGIALRGRPSWLNRYMFPFGEEEIARLLSARLAPAGVAYTMNPGDVLEADSREVHHRVQSSPFVGTAGPSRRPAWEPIDRATFGRLKGSDRRQLIARIEAILAGPFADWFRIEVRRPGSVFSGFVEWGVVWQLVIHCGGIRVAYAIDFSERPWRLVRGYNARANYFFHCSAAGLHRVLFGKGGTEWLLSAGDERFCEKILNVQDGRLTAPPMAGTALHAQLPDPFLVYLATHEITNR